MSLILVLTRWRIFSFECLVVSEVEAPLPLPVPRPRVLDAIDSLDGLLWRYAFVSEADHGLSPHLGAMIGSVL